ncbi:hypothetical protein F5Y09DRAFT_326191 [Xylaria sp. FL1042]|nr:hypothetical protein F5Y09DRAFT_326191 [Xylaria sp. FL1042]
MATDITNRRGSVERPIANKGVKVPRRETNKPSNQAWLELNARWESTGAVETGFDTLDTLMPGMKTIVVKQLRTGQIEEAYNGISEFLDGEYKDHKIDDCVRWHLLLQCVEISPDKTDDIKPQQYISELIINKWPHLAFQNQYNNSAFGNSFKKNCVFPKMHAAPAKKDKRIPFYVAVECGNSNVVGTMIKAGERIDRDSLLRTVRGHDPNSKTRVTALELATSAEYGRLQTIKELLKVDGIIQSPEENKSFNYALEEGMSDVVEIFLQNDKLASTFVTGPSIIQAMRKIDEARSFSETEDDESISQVSNASRIVELLVQKAKGEVFDMEVVENIIKRGLIGIWKAAPNKALSQDLESVLLHLAVFYQKYEFVEQFLDEHASSAAIKRILHTEGVLMKKEEAKYPLWYNNHEWRSESKSEGAGFFPLKRNSTYPGSIRHRIRDKIVNKLIYTINDMEFLSDIFHESNEPFGDLCFDISRIDPTPYTISTFVDSLISHSGTRELLAYEETLRYVEFPPLDMIVVDRETFKENTYLEHDHNEVFKILQWLTEKKVKRIIKLVVPDRLINPHNDLGMAAEVVKFEVEILDWRVLDLSIDIFPKPARNKLKELYLYSSGNRATINHWFSPEGIRKLENLGTLEIKIIKETCTFRNYQELVEDIQGEVVKLQNDMPKLKVPPVSVVPWYPTPKLADLNEISHRVAPKLARWLQNLDAHVKRKRREKGHYKPTKVAILDNGILSIPPVSSDSAKHGAAGEDKKDNKEDRRSLWPRIREGRSFVDENSRLSPWLFASDPHGTQMANLICAIDPCCEIYVARVGEDLFGITPARVAKAINWAIDRGVDIISMSFVVGEPYEPLLKAIQKATSHGIVMTCSTHDEGSRIANAYPAKWMGTTLSLIVLAACDEFGELLRHVEEKEYSYKIRGKDVAAGVIPFLKWEDTISGSSVATALGAGLCSLILTCDRLANPDKEYAIGEMSINSPNSRYAVVTKHLKSMLSETDDQFVLLEKFGGIDAPHIGDAVIDSHEMWVTGGRDARSVVDTFKRH